MEPWERGSRKTSGQTGMCGGVRGVGAGGIVSTAYCLLYKLYTLRLTRKQVNGLLNHTDSPYIRALGFMYLRYTQPPADLYDWYEDYLQDDEEIDVKAGGGQTITIGQMVYQFLTKLDWFSTLFPRIPVPIQKQIEKKIEEYCRNNNISPQQLGSARNVSSNMGNANYDYEDVGYDRRSGGAGSSRSRLPPGASGSYRDEHDDREQFANSVHNRRREDSTEYHSSRDHDHHREKHKKKHKHKHHSRSRSRSRSRSERRRDLDYDRDRERDRDRNRERDYERRGRDYDDRRHR
ncbi:PREDICTED: pre-mRNA-splicing factor 38B isoform X2 [Rhagoletis zephyria]|nr:PREDICTED: pre-mRNA-splicing factor 38B isoform X2 [Rhagoletis zephyria]XP_036338740.1 pre-mRNA-splicing factor 38B isoform X2 [Rhagoletis pomonella]